jgi:hypothetical protein
MRCANARQMRCMLEIDRPEAFAIDRVLRWVAAVGMVFSVAATISVILFIPDPERSARTRLIAQAVPGAANRVRHTVTVIRLVLNCLAMARFAMPLAARSTIEALHRAASGRLTDDAHAPRVR